MTGCSIMSCCEGSCCKCHMLKTGKGMSTAHWLKMYKFEFYLPADGATTKADDAGVAKVKIHKPLGLSCLKPKITHVLTSITVSRYSLFQCPAQSLLTPLQGRRNSLLRLRLRIHCGYGNTTRIHRSHISVRCISTVYIYTVYIYYIIYIYIILYIYYILYIILYYIYILYIYTHE